VKNLQVGLLTAVLAVTLCVGAQAESAAPSAGVKKIGVMDLSKVFDNYQRTKEYDAVLEGKTKDYEKTRNEKIDKIKELQNKMALLKDDEKEKVTKDLDTMRNDLANFDQAQQTDLKKQRDDKIREILLEIEKTTSDFAKKEKYDIILNDRVLVYGTEGMDVSNQVLEILNANFNAGKKK
jgi:Skp family chaperone for outer membrane proteins